MSSSLRLIRKYSLIILIVFGGLLWPRDGKSQDSEDSPVAVTEGNSTAKTAMATASSRIESVLLYSDFAYAKRVMEIKLPAGASEVSLGEVPSNILDKSVSVSFSDPNKKFKIRGVRVLEKISKRFKSRESEELEKRKDALLLSLGTRSKEVQELLDWETSLRSIRPGFREEEGVIEKVDSDSFLGFRKTYSDLAEENTKLRLAKLEELDRLREEFYIVTAKLEHLAQGDVLRRKEIRLEAEIETAATYRIEYKYLIRGAIWYPRYTLDLKPSGTEAELGWYALVRNERGKTGTGFDSNFPPQIRIKMSICRIIVNYEFLLKS